MEGYRLTGDRIPFLPSWRSLHLLVAVLSRTPVPLNKVRFLKNFANEKPPEMAPAADGV